MASTRDIFNSLLATGSVHVAVTELADRKALYRALRPMLVAHNEAMAGLGFAHEAREGTIIVTPVCGTGEYAGTVCYSVVTIGSNKRTRNWEFASATADKT